MKAYGWPDFLADDWPEPLVDDWPEPLVDDWPEPLVQRWVRHEMALAVEPLYRMDILDEQVEK